MSSLRARLRAGPRTVDDEPFERWATTRATDAVTPTMRPSGAKTRVDVLRTPGASGGWNASTRVTPGDSAMASGGERRRRRRASAWDDAREGEWLERDGTTRASTSSRCDVGGASAVKPTKMGTTEGCETPTIRTQRERVRVALTTPDARRRRVSGERAERDGRDATVDGSRSGSGSVSKGKANSSEDVDVEEEVLRILRDVVREAKAAHERVARAACDAADVGIETPVVDAVDARESGNPSKTRVFGRRALVVFASFVFGVIHGRVSAPRVALARAPDVHQSASPIIIQPDRASRFRLDDDVLDASWTAALDRARAVHDAATDEALRKSVRIAAKRARAARKDALALADETSDTVLLTDSTCRAARAFAHLRRAVDVAAPSSPPTDA